MKYSANNVICANMYSVYLLTFPRAHAFSKKKETYLVTTSKDRVKKGLSVQLNIILQLLAIHNEQQSCY